MRNELLQLAMILATLGALLLTFPYDDDDDPPLAT